MRESLSEFQAQGLGNLTLRIVGMTLLFEMAGVMLYSTRFSRSMDETGLYMSVFHAVSAFCNAGSISWAPWKARILPSFLTAATS